MRGHLVAVAEGADELSAWSDDQLLALLTSSDAVNIDKSWEAAFPLIGSIAGTGAMLVAQPEPIGENLGFGPAMFVEPDAVRAIADALERADDATVEAHWATLDSAFMPPDLYEDEWGKRFAMNGYRKVAQLFVSAAGASHGVLFAIL